MPNPVEIHTDSIRKISILVFTAGILFLFSGTPNASAAPFPALGALIGKKDAALIADAHGTVLFSKHEASPLIPASTLKIFTSLLALHHLGRDYRFITEIYIDSKNRLTVKGFGDPMLITESMVDIAKKLTKRIKIVRGIQLDDGYFAKPIDIPGITDSLEPYDAPNGALCVNFNTVSFRKMGSRFVSAEPQTPLLPEVMRRIQKSRLNEGRIVLAGKSGEALLYAGHLLAYFLEKEGIDVKGTVKTGRVNPAHDLPVLRYVSRFSLEEILQKLLEHSNNFIANQLLITAGIKIFGPPGTLDKGIQTAMQYAANRLNITDMKILEGSGISRENRVTATSMHRILQHFLPHRRLMVQKAGVHYKTGTLTNVRSLAGYVERPSDKVYPFVILINTAGKPAEPVLEKIQAGLP